MYAFRRRAALENLAECNLQRISPEISEEYDQHDLYGCSFMSMVFPFLAPISRVRCWFSLPISAECSLVDRFIVASLKMDLPHDLGSKLARHRRCLSSSLGICCRGSPGEVYRTPTGTFLGERGFFRGSRNIEYVRELQPLLSVALADE